MNDDNLDVFRAGEAMWREYAVDYGIIKARVVCLSYLELKAKTTDAEEREFCRGLREAMTMARSFKDTEVYLYSEVLAKLDGKLELYNESDRINRLCAYDIDAAIYAVEYGDGTHEFKRALVALTEQYGLERVSVVLAAEAKWLGFARKLHDDVYQWARGFKLGDHFYGGFHLRTRPAILGEFIAHLREITERENNVEDN